MHCFILINIVLYKSYAVLYLTYINIHKLTIFILDFSNIMVNYVKLCIKIDNIRYY